ncbi:uncharacterized protein JCM15063_004408 [Sporobolomyces koalae]|uniref:uncharacterized protein n=1 Tax=Sporobolomyces koalae TaxID=500713 RepID=UPI00317EF3CA
MPGTDIGTIVYDGVKPLIRVFITTGIGFILIKRNVVPKEGINVFSHLIVNVTLPTLLFAKIVPSFTSDNIGALGPIFLVGGVYQFLAAFLGFIARAITPTPRRYRYGVLASYTFSNWGDLPIGVISSIMTSAPFNKETDEALGIAYVAIFILINYISQFPLQGLRLVALDYTHGISADHERRSEMGEFGTFRKYLNRLLKGMPMQHEVEAERTRYFSGVDKSQVVDSRQSQSASSTVQDDSPNETLSAREKRLDSSPALSSSRRDSRLRTAWNGIKSCIRHTLKPPTISLVCSIVIGVVPELRNLFVPPEASGSRFSPRAPDGLPPLATLYDAASFIGAASVPLGLIVLGASIATIEIPRPVTRLPLTSMVAMAIVKLAILPIFGFFFVKGLVKAGIVDRKNLVLRFGMSFFPVLHHSGRLQLLIPSSYWIKTVLTSLSCVPTSTIQVVWSRLLAPPGVENNSTLLGAYLLVQYCVWAFSSVLITAFTLNTLF